MADKILTMVVKQYLTDNEKRNVAVEMSKLMIRLQLTKVNKKKATSVFTKRIERLTKEIDKTIDQLSLGYKPQSVECRRAPDFNNKVWKIIRIDTDEIVTEDPMIMNDLQRQFDDTDL